MRSESVVDETELEGGNGGSEGEAIGSGVEAKQSGSKAVSLISSLSLSRVAKTLADDEVFSRHRANSSFSLSMLDSRRALR